MENSIQGKDYINQILTRLASIFSSERYVIDTKTGEISIYNFDIDLTLSNDEEDKIIATIQYKNNNAVDTYKIDSSLLIKCLEKSIKKGISPINTGSVFEDEIYKITNESFIKHTNHQKIVLSTIINMSNIVITDTNGSPIIAFNQLDNRGFIEFTDPSNRDYTLDKRIPFFYINLDQISSDINNWFSFNNDIENSLKDNDEIIFKIYHPRIPNNIIEINCKKVDSCLYSLVSSSICNIPSIVKAFANNFNNCKNLLIENSTVKRNIGFDVASFIG